ncbi:NnrU family protein [Tropicimonas isoalkanivorans]|uniref:NnrU protein n=1 Tax=Tropicimonas isoalkanivorans TaxID=441112 RepID=A0A1I1NDT6_9RHOB|nr:NnrU family protein [Tropicimonas isoalkanivorans]SFC95546.1 NnrU protein [Tropicimonas isoalkanivorans]
MGWILLILGVALWWGAHELKRFAPERRASLGAEKGKGVIAIALVVAIVLMVIGFRGTPVLQVWYPPAFFTHINNLLVLIAIFMMSPAPKKGRLLNRMRHPMLAGFSLWAVAHLLVNGDLASIVLFGGLLSWSLTAPVLINRAEPEWTAPAPGTYGKDAMFLAASAVLLIVIGLIHSWLGYYPFG